MVEKGDDCERQGERVYEERGRGEWARTMKSEREP